MKLSIIFVTIIIIITVVCGFRTNRKAPTVTIELPKPYGFLKGIIAPTKGNLGRTPKPYRVFRNIPYAKPITKETRFKQSEPLPDDYKILGPDEDHPYDATRTGPLCIQNGMSPKSISDTMGKMNVKIIEEFLNKTIIKLKPETVINVFEKIIETGLPLKNMTLGETIHEWLDIDLSVSEDCLHLTVSAPDKIPPKEGFPVMFFVHGGAFMGGTHIMSEADRLGDVADVIVVSINYRVEVLGFLCLDSDEGAGNQGLLDMVLALEWVQKYISHFGGDKDRVTIFGESAGSAAIGHLLLSPLTRNKKLFIRGIGQSGSAISPWAFDNNPRKHAYVIAEKMGCKLGNDDKIIECLREKDPSEISEAFTYERRANMDLGFGGSTPCSQTKGKQRFYSESETPFRLLTSGDYNTDVDILFGANLREGAFVYNEIYNSFLKVNNYTTHTKENRLFLENDLVPLLLKSLNFKAEYAVLDLIMTNYFKPREIGNLKHMTDGLIDIFSVFFIKSSTYDMVAEHVRHGGNAYWYSLEYISKQKSVCHFLCIMTEVPDIHNFGACHGDELMYLFDYDFPFIFCDIKKLMMKMALELVKCWGDIDCLADDNGHFKNTYGECLDSSLTEEEQKISDSIVKVWTTFAINGTLDVKGLPKLSHWKTEDQSYIVFDKENAIKRDYYKTFITSKH